MIRNVAAVLTMSLTLSVAAQVSETIEVAVTSVDVVVTDAKGNRVRGLTKADFQVIEDGKVREITNFSEYALTAPSLALSNAAATVSPQAAPSQAVLTPPRRLLILFDSNTLTSKHRRNGAADALKFIDKHVRPADKVMVGVLTQQFKMRTDWTSDREELRRVISAIGSEVTAIGVDSDRKDAEEEMSYLLDIAAGTLGLDPRVAAPPRFEELINIARKYAEQAFGETRRTAALIEKIVSQFAAYPEKKAMIFIGEGLESRPGWELFEKLEAIRSGQLPSVGVQISTGQNAQGNSTASAPVVVVAEMARYNASSLLQHLAESSFRKGVPIYAINPGTNQDADTESKELSHAGQQFARFASRADGYTMVGDGSGGAAFIGMRAELALDQVAADMGSYYSIGFRASGPAKRASIRVKPQQAGHKVRVALAGTPIAPADPVTDAVTAHHVLEPSTNDLEIALETLDPVAAGEKQKVTLHVIIPIRNLSLVRQGEDLTGGFDIYLSISDGKGYFSPVNKQSHAIKWPASTAGVDDERTMTYSIDVTMEPGASQISVGVVDQRSKKTGYERIGV